jgi:hypothetical protein
LKTRCSDLDASVLASHVRSIAGPPIRKCFWLSASGEITINFMYYPVFLLDPRLLQGGYFTFVQVDMAGVSFMPGDPDCADCEVEELTKDQEKGPLPQE